MKQLTFLTTILCLFIASATFAQVNKRSKVEYAMCKAKVAKMVKGKVKKYKSEKGTKPSKELVQKWNDSAMEYAGCEALNPDAVTRSILKQQNNKGSLAPKMEAEVMTYKFSKKSSIILYAPTTKKIYVVDTKIPAGKKIDLPVGKGVLAAYPAKPSRTFDVGDVQANELRAFDKVLERMRTQMIEEHGNEKEIDDKLAFMRQEFLDGQANNLRDYNDSSDDKEPELGEELSMEETEDGEIIFVNSKGDIVSFD